jgi:hypothetical protein
MLNRAPAVLVMRRPARAAIGFFEPLLPIVVTRSATTSFFARIKTEYEDRIIAILNGHS